MSNPPPIDFDEVIARGRRVAEEAEQALETVSRHFAERDIDPARSLELVRAQGGDAAVERVHQQVRQALHEADAQVERKRLHTPKARASSQQPRILRNMV